MSRKIILLIIASTFGFIGLSFIQTRLITNTYSLRKEAFTDKANKKVSGIGSYGTPIDSINDAISDTFIKELDNYLLGTSSQERILQRLKVISDSLNPKFIREYEKEIGYKKLDYNLKYHNMLKRIIVVDSLRTDTIYDAKKSNEIKLIGYDFENNPDLRLGSSTSQTNRSFERNEDGVLKQIDYELIFETTNYINIEDWNTLILGEMKSLLIYSFLIFLFVIGLFYYSIKSLITQKKIADVKTDFINNITHELKTPLSTLALATKILRKQEFDKQSDIAASTVATIERQNFRLQKLIDQVMSNSLGYEDIKLEKESVNFNDFLNTILDDFEVNQTETIVLKRGLFPKGVIIKLDAFYIGTAITNILENAVKYGATKIEVDLSTKDKLIHVSIADNGIGIHKKHQELIFQKFFRSENKNVHNVKGLGLGLYYSNQIAKAHKGSISITSEKGKGSTFTISLPLNI